MSARAPGRLGGISSLATEPRRGEGRPGGRGGRWRRAGRAAAFGARRRARRGTRRRGPTMLAARALPGSSRTRCARTGSSGSPPAAGCAGSGLGSGDDALAELGRAVAARPPAAVDRGHLPAGLWQPALGGRAGLPLAGRSFGPICRGSARWRRWP